MTFEARASGPVDGPLVILLHGFPQTSYAYRHQLRALGALGYRAVAPDQRGYSPGARPEGITPYGVPDLTADVVGMADALDAARFDLVGHDWGGAVAWVVATRFPERVRTLTVLSTPHNAALAVGLGEEGSEQARRSAYFADFAAPGAERRFLADDAALLRRIYGDLDPEVVAAYMATLGNPAALRAALAWYAAAFGDSASSGSVAAPAPTPVTVPTLYVWSTDDVAFARATAEATERFVSGPYRFEVLEGVDHWITDQAPEEVTRLLVEHLQSPPPGSGN
ncbi:MAG: alpha/beta hydrolase [Gemmatimonadetes bacterium]|nr:alpha/beta hydrolase [Gemmatimonadota bacterium]